MSRGSRKAAKVARRLAALAKRAPSAAAYARYESTRGWDGRLASIRRPGEAWAAAVAALLAWGLT